MPKQTQNAKGKSFENKVYEVLLDLKLSVPSYVEIQRQPRLSLYDGQEVIPDFDFQFDLLFSRNGYLIECQDRKRSSTQIAQKIKYVKALSSRNRFLFIYANSIPRATQKALEVDGVIFMSFDEFTKFISALKVQIKSQAENNSILFGRNSVINM